MQVYTKQFGVCKSPERIQQDEDEFIDTLDFNTPDNISQIMLHQIREQD